MTTPKNVTNVHNPFLINFYRQKLKILQLIIVFIICNK